jgi:undecaprenyl diphosphate synthase
MADLPDKLPRHVAVIMDGNGRWAKARGLPRNEGHKAGAESAARVAECCVEFGIPVLTLYAFSTENWRRPRGEVQFLMSNLRRFLRERRAEFLERDIRVVAIGEVEELPGSVRRELSRTEEATRDCRSLTLVTALNYGSRSEIAHAARSIAEDVRAGRIDPEAVDEALVEERLYTAGLPAVDLLIRTGGEMRVSNFLLWQVSYAEFYVTPTCWPDFDRDAFVEALQEFARRERRFGGLSGERRAGAVGERDSLR